MSKADKLFERMKLNPLGGFSIDHVKTICGHYGLSCDPPKRGSHFTISHNSQQDILTVPSKRPIKAVYIRKLVAYIEAVRATQDAGKNSISNRDRTSA